MGKLIFKVVDFNLSIQKGVFRKYVQIKTSVKSGESEDIVGATGYSVFTRDKIGYVTPQAIGDVSTIFKGVVSLIDSAMEKI